MTSRKTMTTLRDRNQTTKSRSRQRNRKLLLETLEDRRLLTTYTFTTGGATGNYGPTQAMLDAAYAGTNLAGQVSVSATGIQAWAVPATATYTIVAAGAQGASGDPSYVGGKGARVSGDFALTAGATLYLAVGQMGVGQSSGSNGGGGGGSFVVDASDTPLLIAGGGGGTRSAVLQNGIDGQVSQYGTIGSGSAEMNPGTLKTTGLGQGGIVSSESWGSAGAGFYSNGADDRSSSWGTGGRSWLNGLVGGNAISCDALAFGGFGGGGAGNGCWGGGGGGGYSGGDGGRVAGGGGSFNAGANPTGIIGYQAGHGLVTITLVGSLSASVDGAGNLTVTDIDATGKDNNLTVQIDGSGNLVISDANELFHGAPSGWTLSADGKSISRLASSFTGSIAINGAGGNDTLTVDASVGNPVPSGGISFDGGAGGNDSLAVVGNGTTTTATYTPDATTQGSGTVVLNGTGTISFSNLEPVDITGMVTATVASPANPANALSLAPGFDFATGSVPAIVVSGNTGLGPTLIEAAHLFNNTNVVLDTSATTGAGANTITVAGAIPLGHNNTNLTLTTNANGSVAVNAAWAVSGTVNVQSPTVNLNDNIGAASITGAATTVNVNNTTAQIQDGIGVAAATGATITVAAGTYAENLILNKQATLKGAQFGVDARSRVVGAPNPATETIVASAGAAALNLQLGSNAAVIDGFSFVGSHNLTEGVIGNSSGTNANLQVRNNYVLVAAGFTTTPLYMNRPAVDATFTRNKFVAAAGSSQAVFFDGPDAFHGLQFTNNNVLRSSGVSGTGIFVDGNHNVSNNGSVNTPLIKGNYISGFATGANLGSRSFDNGEISENTFTGNSTNGLQGGPQHTQILRNTFTNTGTGIALTSFGNSGADRGAQFTTISQNVFSGNATVDVFFSAAQAVGTIATNKLFNNSLGSTTAVTYGGTEVIQASGNWWGNASGPTVATNPGGTGNSIGGTGAANVDFSPWLDVSTDTDGGVPGTPGFQGSFSVLHVEDTSPHSTYLSAATTRVQEAINLVTASEVILDAGTYNENVAANVVNLLLRGGTGNPADVVLDGNTPSPIGGTGVTVSADNVTLKDLRITDYATGIATSGAAKTALTLTNLLVDTNTTGANLANITALNVDTNNNGQTVRVNVDNLNAIAPGQFSVDGAVQYMGYSSVTTLDVDTLGGDDTVNVAPHASTVIDLDGGPHSGGDTLVYYYVGATNNFAANPTLTTGYANINHANFESFTYFGGPIHIIGSGLDDKLTITASGNDDGSYQLIEDYTGGSPIVNPVVNFLNCPSFTFDGAGGNDWLVIDNTGGVFQPASGIFFNGQTDSGPPGDKMTLSGGSVTTVEHVFDNANDGSVWYNGAQVITYTGLEPIDDSISADERIFTFMAGAETVTLSTPGDGGLDNKIDSDLGEFVNFNNPTDYVRIVTDSAVSGGTVGADIIQIQGLHASFSADLIVDGDADDSLTFVNAIDIDDGDLDAEAASIVLAGKFTTAGDATLNALTTTISGTAAGVDLEADDLVAQAVTGIDLDTTVTTLDAVNSAAGGNITIDETDALNINRIDQNAAAGTVSVTAGWTITVVAGQSGVAAVNGQVTLDANGVNSDVRVNDTIDTTGGAIDLLADDDISFSLAGDVTSVTGDVTVTADANFGGGGGITMANGALIDAGSGKIVLYADGDIALGGLRTTDGTPTAVSISSVSGGVTDAGDAHVDIVANSVGAVVTITAQTGIGASNAIETWIASLDADVQSSGGIGIQETDALVLAPVTTADGPITVAAGGQITATYVESATDAEANDIILTNSGGDILAAWINAGTNLGDVYLNAAAGIEETGADGSPDLADIVGQDIELVAAAGIGDDAAQLEIDAGNLAARTGAGDIRLHDTAGGLTIASLDVDGGGSPTNGVSITGGAAADHVTIRASDAAGSSLTANAPVSNSGGGNIILAAEGAFASSDLTLNANVTASGGDGNIKLYGGDSISLAATVAVSAAGDGQIQLNASTNYNNGAPGNGYPGGAGEAGSAGRVAMASGSVVQSEDGDIYLFGDGDILLSIADANSDADANWGDVTITADYDGDGGGMEDGAGAIIDYLAAETANVFADWAVLWAATGIGSGDDLETNIGVIDATNRGLTGDIQIYQVAPGPAVNSIGVERLTQFHAGGDGNILLTTEDGDIEILSAGGGVTVRGSGQVRLDANADTSGGNPTEAVLARGSIDIDAVVSTASGDMMLYADHDLTGDDNGDLTSGGAGSITITADANNTGLGGNDDGTIQLEGDIAAGTGTLTFSLRDCDGWLGAAAPTGDGEIISASGVIKNGLGALRLNGADNAYTGTTNVNAGTLLVHGSLTADTGIVHVNNGGTLGGNGTIGTTPLARDVLVHPGGVLDPGDISTTGCAPLAGQLTVNGDVEVEPASGVLPAGKFRVQLGGLAPGVGGYDQLVLNGTGNLYGSVTSGAGGGALEVQIVSGYSVPVGGEYVIISNDLADLIGTRFLGLPEGAFLYPGGVMMNISYLAGVGDNDVVLTAPGRYDFNGFYGYTAENYMPLSPFTLKDTGNSAGWETRPPYYFERNWPDAPPYDTEQGKLIYDGQSTDYLGTPLTFLVDVVAGKTYEVLILTGDTLWNHDREQFTVTGTDVATPVTAKVDAWGAGAPEGSGTNVTWGGGTANPTAGYYRWVRLTVPVGGTPNAITQIEVNMQDLGGWDPATVILGMDIRPVETVGQITLTPFLNLPADGVTWDTYTGSGAPPNATLTVTGFAPDTDPSLTVDNSHYLKIEGVSPAAADQDLTAFGTQIRSDASGNFTFRAQRPSLTSPVNFTVEESSGLSRGTMTETYTAPDTGFSLRFDFGVSGSPVQTYGSPAKKFLEVVPQTIYSATRGYGWTSRVAGVNRKDPGMSDLRRDLNYAKDATFKVNLPNGDYSVRIYHSNPKYNGTVSYVADNFQVSAEGVPQYTVTDIPAGTTDIRTFTVTVSGGALELRLQDLGGQDGNFVIAGLDISAGLNSWPTPALLLASGEPQDGGAAAISVEELQGAVEEASARWAAAGLTAAQAATLGQVQFAVADLGGAVLGLANPATNTVRIDDDAAMLGWSVIGDRSSVIGDRSSVIGDRWSVVGDRLPVTDHRLPVTGVSLLTVVMHELGHLLGYEHTADGLMAPVLGASPPHPSSFILPPSSFLPHPSSFLLSPAGRADDVFAALESSDEASSPLWESQEGTDVLAAATLKSSDEAPEARVPGRSPQRHERELDKLFSELAVPSLGPFESWSRVGDLAVSKWLNG